MLAGIAEKREFRFFFINNKTEASACVPIMN